MVGGEVWVGDNPRLTIDAVWHDFVRMWFACRGGMGGIAHWPDGGGVAHQSAWVVDAFGALGGIDHQMEQAGKS